MTTILLNGPPTGPHDASAGDRVAAAGSGMFEVQLTRTGAMMGTPAYMAPEQFLGTATDARTDQFSFCVALYEALYGERPFSGNTMFALTTAVVQGQVKEAPPSSKVPLWVRKVLLRGLRAAGRRALSVDARSDRGARQEPERRAEAVPGGGRGGAGAGGAHGRRPPEPGQPQVDLRRRARRAWRASGI